MTTELAETNHSQTLLVGYAFVREADEFGKRRVQPAGPARQEQANASGLVIVAKLSDDSWELISPRLDKRIFAVADL
jgi:hypothetical protein